MRTDRVQQAELHVPTDILPDSGTVRECSDSDATDPAQKLPSAERKRVYLRHLPTVSNDALLVTLADKVHNARSILGDYRQIGDQIWSRFNVGKEDQPYYSGLLEIFSPAVSAI